VGKEHDIHRFCSFVFEHQRFHSSTVKLFTHYMDAKDTQGTGTMTRCASPVPFWMLMMWSRRRYRDTSLYQRRGVDACVCGARGLPRAGTSS
jgi:hypothetical protein